MSITIQDRPANYSPVYNELPFTATSNQEAQENFRFIIQLYGDASLTPSELLHEFSLPPHPNGGCMFDPSKTLKDYMSFDVAAVQDLDTGFTTTSNTGMFYSVRFIEQYGDPETLHASGGVGNKTTFNGSLPWVQKLSETLGDWIMTSVNQAKFLTNSPRNIRVAEAERYYLGYMCNVLSDSPVKPDFRMVIETYDQSGAIIQTYTINNGLSLDDDERFNNISVGPADLNASTLSSGSQPVITDSVAYYTVRVQDSNSANRSETFRFTIDRNCSQYETYRLFWLNPWGRLDAFTFKGYNKPVTKSERSTEDFSRRQLGTLDGISYVYNTARHSVYPFYTQYQNGVNLETDFITRDERDWLKELMISPAVFYMDSDNNLWAVNIKGPAQIDTRTRGALGLQFEMEFAHKNQSQQR